MKKYKCLALMSGGLDSILVSKILKDDGVSVTPICFKSYFFDSQQSEKSVKQLGLKLRVVDISEEHLKMIKNPLHGRGKGFNPCIDCHSLMIKEAEKIMKKEGYDFIATGEVLGQRPMSQNANSLKIIDKSVKSSRLIIRPLSAKLLPLTIPEEKGMVKTLYAISGKSREDQINLAKKLKIKEYPSPAGGCILTDLNYAKNLKKLKELKNNFSSNDILILREGRVFWENHILIIVARDENECKNINKLRLKSDLVLEPNNFSGPTVLVRRYKKSPREEAIDFGVKYLLNYSNKKIDDPIIKLLPFLES